MISRTFKLCLNAGSGSAPYINVNQYDEGETWLFELHSENGERYIPSSGAIVGVKSDGHGIVNTGTVDSEGRVVITETQQMTASAGRAIYELSIDGLTHGTANFIVVVERKPTDDAVMSDSDLSLIQQAVDAAETIEDLIEGHDPDEVIADAVDDWLDAHPEATTTVEDGAITSAKLNDSVKTGVFEDMTVGTSLSVWNDTGTTDNLAYKFRPTGGDAVRELDEIVGGTIAWNQMAGNGITEGSTTINGVTFTIESDGSVTVNGTASAQTSYNYGARVSGHYGHKRLIIGCPSGGGAAMFRLKDGYGTNSDIGQGIIETVNNDYSIAQILVASGYTANNLKFKPQIFDLTAMFGSTVADAIYAMEQSSAGSGVAYFRSLFPNAYYPHNSGELVSVEGLSSHDTVGFNLFDGDNFTAYYGYLRQYSADAYQWKMSLDSRSVAIKCLPNTTYCAYINGLTPTILRVGATAESTLPQPTSGDWEIPIEKAFASSTSERVTYTTGANAKWLIVQINASYFNDLVSNNLCINISSPENGTYKPYTKHTYPLDSTLTLRGVPKWNNGLYYDGDIYRHDGSVSRRYGVVDLGSLTWTNGGSFKLFFSTGLNALIRKASANTVVADWIFLPSFTPISYNSITASTTGTICVNTNGSIGVNDGNTYSSVDEFKSAMSGVYLVYELATPTTETADPYQQYQICDGKGTEEYVSTSVTPVGHNTIYPVDIVAKVNKLPSDFSTLIAPTEEGFTATRNYVAKNFLIVNNQLYKVTANIANGGTITPNTNVTAVTIADILTTLI